MNHRQLGHAVIRPVADDAIPEPRWTMTEGRSRAVRTLAGCESQRWSRRLGWQSECLRRSPTFHQQHPRPLAGGGPAIRNERAPTPRSLTPTTAPRPRHLAESDRFDQWTSPGFGVASPGRFFPRARSRSSPSSLLASGPMSRFATCAVRNRPRRVNGLQPRRLRSTRGRHADDTRHHRPRLC